MKPPDTDRKIGSPVDCQALPRPAIVPSIAAPLGGDLEPDHRDTDVPPTEPETPTGKSGEHKIELKSTKKSGQFQAVHDIIAEARRDAGLDESD